MADNSVKTEGLRPFKPGQSGNPRGRPKIPQEVKEAIRAACPDAVQVLINIMHDEKAKKRDRIAAAESILDRGYGKPEVMSKVELSGENSGAIMFKWMTGENGAT